MQSNEQIHLMYEVNGGSMIYNEEPPKATQDQYNGNGSLEIKDKKPPRRLSSHEEECLFVIWGRDNWRLTQPGKNMAIFTKWSQELKERFDVDLKPLEIQTKVNATRLKFRQVLKQCATDRNALKKWKRFHLVGKILSNQYRSLDAEEISPEDLKKNRDMVFIESMTGFLNDANNPQSNEESNSIEKDATDTTGENSNIKPGAIYADNTFQINGPDNNGTTTANVELNNILAVHESQQNQQLYQYLQQQQQHVGTHQETTPAQQQTHDNTEYYEEALEHLQPQVPQNLQLLQPEQQQDQQYGEAINPYMTLSQEAHVSVIQTNQSQVEVQPQQQQQQIQYQQSLMLPLQHQTQSDDPTIFIKPVTPLPLIQPYLEQNNWNTPSLKVPPLLQTKRTYRSKTSNMKANNDIKDKANNQTDDKMISQMCGNDSSASSTVDFSSANKKRRISSIANSKEILKFREDWLKQQDVKNPFKTKEENLFQNDQEQQQKLSDTEVVTNTSIKGATEVEMLYLAEVCRRNEILAEQKNISYKLLRLEERKVALMESFFPKCFKLQEEFLEHSLKQSRNRKEKNDRKELN